MINDLVELDRWSAVAAYFICKKVCDNRFRNTSTIRKFSFELGNLEGEIGLTLAIQEKITVR
jgi:hypothetical protein